MKKVSEIHNDFKLIRSVLCMDQTEFANKLGISRDYVKAIECGRCNISVALHKKLAECVNSDGFFLALGRLNAAIERAKCYAENKQEKESDK